MKMRKKFWWLEFLCVTLLYVLNGKVRGDSWGVASCNLYFILRDKLVFEHGHSNFFPPVQIDYLLTYTMQQSPSWEATGFQLVKKFPAFYRTRRFITTFTSACHLSVSWDTLIQSIPPHPTSWRLILNIILPSMRGSPKWSLSLRFHPPEPCIHLSSPPYALHALSNVFFLVLSPEQYWVRNTDHKASHCVVAV